MYILHILLYVLGLRQYLVKTEIIDRSPLLAWDEINCCFIWLLWFTQWARWSISTQSLSTSELSRIWNKNKTSEPSEIPKASKWSKPSMRHENQKTKTIKLPSMAPSKRQKSHPSLIFCLNTTDDYPFHYRLIVVIWPRLWAQDGTAGLDHSPNYHLSLCFDLNWWHTHHPPNFEQMTYTTPFARSSSSLQDDLAKKRVIQFMTLLLLFLNLSV